MVRVVFERDNVNDEFVLVTKIYRHHGDVVAQEDVVIDVETSKTMKEVRAPVTGVLHISLSEGDEVPISQTLFEIQTASSSDNPSNVTAPSESPDTMNSEANPHAERNLSRSALALAKSLGVDLNTLPTGWVTTTDVANAAGKQAGGRREEGRPDPITLATPPPRIAPPIVPFRSERVSIRKRTETRNLMRANGHGNLSMLAIHVSVSTHRIVEAPFLFQESIADLVVFESSRLLRQYSELNSFLLDDRTVGYYDEVNFGISFDSGRNLKVLSLAKADILSLPGVQGGIENLLHLYESGATIEANLLANSTVTLSDLSRSSIAFMLPLLNGDQSLILGLTRGKSTEFGIHASFDHRIAEGLRVARFLEELSERIQSHFRTQIKSTDHGPITRCSACDRSMADEVMARGRGFLKMALADGSDGQICRTCFEGW